MWPGVPNTVMRWCLSSPVRFASSCRATRACDTVISPVLEKSHRPVAGDDVVNAVLHCTWMCRVANYFLCGRDRALQLGEASELGTWEQSTAHAHAMDRHNNQIGASILLTPFQGTDDCIRYCEQRAWSYRLYWFAPSSSPSQALPPHFPGYTIATDGSVPTGALGSSADDPPPFTAHW